MAAAGNNVQEQTVRLNQVDWDILEVMSDGQRYTQQYLYDDVEELDDYSGDWIRKRVSHLADSGLIEKVGSSSMYTISDLGQTALDKRPVYDDHSPAEFAKIVHSEVSE